jgi:hypothetical protein
MPKLSQSDLKASVDKHQVPKNEIDANFKWSTAWVLEGARSLKQPVPYRYPAGAVIWVKLGAKLSATVEQQWLTADAGRISHHRCLSPPRAGA